MIDWETKVASPWARLMPMPVLRSVLELVGAGLVCALIFWATVTWLSSVILAFALAAGWLVIVVILLRRRPHQNVALLALSIVATLGLVELALQSGALPDFLTGLPGHSLWDRGRIEMTEPKIKVFDEQLGYRFAGPVRARSIAIRNDVVLYDVHYTINEARFRVTPGDAGGGRPIAVMGDSFHFGDGVEDDQTLSAHMARQAAGRLHPINLATSGYGPNQVLRQLQLGRWPPSGPQRFDYLLLSVIDEHVMRASGKVKWMLDSPRYEFAEGRLVLAGTFRPSSRFVDNLLAESLEAALVVRALDNRRRPDEERRFSAILREIQAEAKAKYGAELLVLFHALYDPLGHPIGDGSLMHDLICKAGVPYIDVVARLSVTRESYPRYYIPGDGHPTSELNARAARLAIDYIDGKEPPDRCGN